MNWQPEKQDKRI